MTKTIISVISVVGKSSPTFKSVSEVSVSPILSCASQGFLTNRTTTYIFRQLALSGIIIAAGSEQQLALLLGQESARSLVLPEVVFGVGSSLLTGSCP